MSFREKHIEINQWIFEYWYNKFYPAPLDSSWIYDLELDYEAGRQWPNHWMPGVYIFFSEKRIWNVGKSKNNVGDQLKLDAAWVRTCAKQVGEPSALVTVHVPRLADQPDRDCALELERYLISKLQPTHRCHKCPDHTKCIG